MAKEKLKKINITNWEKFQHYKDRRPTWIKLLIEIIDEFDADGKPKKFHKLPDTAKLTFILLACLRAHYNEQIPYPNDKWLKNRLGIGSLNLQPLVNKGFISIDTDSVQDDTVLVQNGTDCLPPETERETERETEKDNVIVNIFKHWNSKKEKGNVWKSHNDLAPEIEGAITDRLKDYTPEQLIQSIDNYAKILLSEEFVWTKNWTLREFLTRTRPDDRKELQLYRFLPHNFSLYDFQPTKKGEKMRKQRNEYSEKIKASKQEKLIEAYKNNTLGLNWLVDELRPEIKDLITEGEQGKEAQKGL